MQVNWDYQVVETSIGKPYIDEGNIRTLDHLQDESEFVWHRDQETRKITVLEGQGWQLQYNGEFPVELIEGDEYHIPGEMYHRVLPGINDLVLKIEKLEH